MKDLIIILTILYCLQLFFIFQIIIMQDNTYRPLQTKKQFILCLIPFVVPLYLLCKVIVLAINEIKKLK